MRQVLPGSHNILPKFSFRKGMLWLVITTFFALLLGACSDQPDLPSETQTVTNSPVQTPIKNNLPLSQPAIVPDYNPTPPVSKTVSPLPGSASSTLTPNPPPAPWWQPITDKPIHWHWQLSDDFVYPRDVLPNVTVYDIDGEHTSAETVTKLHALGPNIKVICYIDAGVYEDYRSDASRFPKSVIGKADTGWNGSYWLDIRQIDVILPIMRDRMQHWCKDKGFDAVEPDETEVWSNNSGFPITKAQNNLYNQKIAEMAHSMGLSVGLKGNTSEAPELWQYFDWSLNEQCWHFKECDKLKSSFLDHGKAVFNIEYETHPDCTKANTWHMNSAFRDLNLVGPTNPDYRYSPCIANALNDW
ncbi:MAG TPA: endo alpha-1,4 polygalactosaminidase [Chloroflexia bacterium]|nr:endo alpha-1,4 polygalactosaminidase [Chloroflexia bacterium]